MRHQLLRERGDEVLRGVARRYTHIPAGEVTGGRRAIAEARELEQDGPLEERLIGGNILGSQEVVLHLMLQPGRLTAQRAVEPPLHLGVLVASRDAVAGGVDQGRLQTTDASSSSALVALSARRSVTVKPFVFLATSISGSTMKRRLK